MTYNEILMMFIGANIVSIICCIVCSCLSMWTEPQVYIEYGDKKKGKLYIPFKKNKKGCILAAIFYLYLYPPLFVFYIYCVIRDSFKKKENA